MPTRTFLPYKSCSRASLSLAILILLCGIRPCCGETLRELLLVYKIPAVSFTQSQLSASVQGTGKIDGGRAILIYSALNGDSFVGPIQAIEYDFGHNATRKSRLHFDPGDVCLGSPEDVYLIDGYTLFSTHISPSAECLLLLDNKLAIEKQFYGFFPVRIAPGLIAITENMVHFAAVHAERMEAIDLRTGKTAEIYPPANDPLRARLALQHTKRMPPSETCMRMNDPCDPRLFDEDFSPVLTDGKGRLAFVASQSASHALAENTEPKTVAEQAVFYSYALKSGNWYYCQELIQATESDTLQLVLKDHFETEISRHCTPDRLVSPDMSTAAFNPLRNP